MKVALAHNPKAGRGHVSRDDLERMLRNHGYEPMVVPEEGNVLETVRSHGLRFVVVAGGDGTLRKSALDLVGTGIAFAPVPLGTANNVGRSLGVTGSPEEIVAAWNPDHVRDLDIGVAEGPWGQHYFLEGCGIGLIGRAISIIKAIDEATVKTFEDPEDKLHRDLSVFIALVHEIRPVPIDVVYSETHTRDDFLLIEVMNIQHAGPRIKLSERADPSDGYLDLVLASRTDRAALRHSLQTCLAGRVPDPILRNIRTPSVRLSFASAEFRLDDEVIWDKRDQPGNEPSPIQVTLSCLPGALKLITPSNGATKTR